MRYLVPSALLSALAGVLLAAAACLPGTRVATGPGTARPCGVWGKECGNGMCCGEEYACGGSPGCGPGLCCYLGEPGSAPWGERVRREDPQWQPAP